MRKTKIQYQFYLNELGIPQDDLRSNNGRIPDYAKYGNWIRTHDKIAFEIGYREWIKT